MGLFFGLSAALCWGVADMLVRYATRAVGTYRTLFFMQFIGLLALSVYLLSSAELQHIASGRTWQPWAWGIFVALLNMLSSLALYRAFAVGSITMLSPITSSYAAITSALAILTGEKVSSLHICGMLVVLVGVVLVSTPLGSRREKLPAEQLSARKWLPPGLLWALLASLGYGVAFWLLGFRVTPELGALVPTWLTRLVSPCALLCCFPLSKQPLKLPRGRVWWLILGVGITDTAAYLAYNMGLAESQISIVSVLASLYSGVTVVLAWLLLREQLRWSQWLGIGVVFVGIALVNV
ncbi:DMT family transporter [Ktedonosporobacter rubrisoli]|uniref:DMT family transporter n=1 Tax=Ktedonosporobacter rubrisoli TaxID=2509675 RepID=A0A4P6JWI2_KTERU|nr:DMT family transporter [Ktedonosporobacter rubrisoli]QBD79825.1 DMT family transporter [Ktedonosporobacter rubrisoli]